MKAILFLSALLWSCPTFAFAGVKPGENILLNGRFETDQPELPLFWTCQSGRRFVSWTPSGGPGGLPSVKFANPAGNATGEVSFRQYGLGLAPDGIYRISARVRTKDFKSRSLGAVVVNQGWFDSVGVGKIQENQDWTLLSREVKMMPSNDGTYSAVIYAIDFTGEMEVADFRLEAVSADALANSSPSSVGASSRVLRLVPWSPILHRIPKSHPQVTFRLFGQLPAGDSADYAVTLTTPAGTARAPLAPSLNTLTLPAGATGGEMVVSVQGRNGTSVLSQAFGFGLIDVPPAAPANHRRLNNLVTEVLAAPLAPSAAEQRHSFHTVRDGWTFTAVETPAADALAVTIDGKPVMAAGTPRLEAFRELPAGEHVISVTGTPGGGRVTVRSIAETFNYCPGVDSPVKENPPYDWAFQERYGLPAVTTQNGGNVPEDRRDWFRAQGYRWLANLGTTELEDGADLTRRLDGAGGLTDPCHDGVTCDEQFFGQPDILERYTRGLRAYRNPNDRLIYTWIVGKPATPGVDQDFMSASINASRGRGKLMFEAYCRTKATEAEARAYLADHVTDTLEKYRAWYPPAGDATGIAFGDFNQIPILSLTHHPEVDYKYYLDMQLNLVANDPAFDGLSCAGYWGSYYADHELHRWALLLLRHYCVEGKTSMLSAKHGFSYIPGHLTNGDFRGTLAPWAAKGNVRTDRFEGLGSRCQNRWGGNGGLGDTFATFAKGSDGAVDTLTQRATGLVPGRAYCLQFATFDARDVKANRFAPRHFALDATLSPGAEVRPELSWVHVDKRQMGRYAHNDGVARINLHHLVFTARAPEVQVTFSDAGSHPGEELGLNCVSLNPFLLEES